MTVYLPAIEQLTVRELHWFKRELQILNMLHENEEDRESDAYRLNQAIVPVRRELINAISQKIVERSADDLREIQTLEKLYEHS